MGVLTAVLVYDAGPPRQAPTAHGGLVLLTNRTQRQDTDAATVAVRISQLGYEGLSEMRVTVQFPEARPDLRWALVASGQYQVAFDAPDNGYCRFFPKRRSSTRVSCLIDVEGAGPVLIDKHREIGVTAEDGLYGLQDYDGYDSDTSSMIRGGIPSYRTDDPEYGTVEVAFPIRSPETASGGSNTYGALAPVAAINLGDFGSFPKLSDQGASSEWGQLVDAVDLTPLEPAAVSDVTLSLSEDLGFKEIAIARPRTVSDEELTWTSPLVRRESTRYVVHDPIAEGGLLRRTFLGGVIGGVAASFLVWGVELWYARRRRND